ncbi:sensor histidine kinase [Bacteroides hominis]
MKLPIKHIAILVIASLIAIFAYQTYWLVSMYHTMKTDMEHSITEAMRTCDYNEMMLRIECMRRDDKDHGEISVSAGYNDEGGTLVRSSTTVHKEKVPKGMDVQQDTILRTEKKLDTLIVVRNAQREIKVIPKDSTSQEVKAAMLQTKGGLDLLLKDQSSMLELATYFQRGLHSGLDIIMDPDFQSYDSLLTLSLQERGITLPYRIEYLRFSHTLDSTQFFTDTLGVAGTADYIPGPDAHTYDYTFDIHSHSLYRLRMDSVAGVIVRQMAGILITSFIILLILGFSFWYLIRTLLRQKTLEEMKSDFTNNITHELKTPIAVAYAANDALLNFGQADEKEKRDRYLNISQEQLQRLSGLVEQILTMSMEQRKAFRLRPEEITLIPLLETLAEQHRLKAKKPVSIDYKTEPEDLTVFADRTHFSNILSNLIDNAVKYSSEKAVIHIRCRETEVNGKVEISVTDEGIGIAQEKQKHIFDKFYRVPTGNLHNVKGYGLGLYYVKTMIEKHGGTVCVESEPGHGSTFTIML